MAFDFRRFDPRMIEGLRRRNTTPPPMAQPEEEPDFRMVSPVDEEAQMERPAFSDYRDHLGRMPHREDSKPSFGRKAVSGVVGALQAAATRDPGSGVKVAEDLRDARYNNSLADWSREGVAKRSLVDLESQDSALQMQRVRALNDARYKEGQLHNTYDRNSSTAEHYGAQEKHWGQVDQNRATEIGNTNTYHNRVAATGERNAQTNENRLDIDAERVGQYGRRTDAIVNKTNKKDPPPSQQVTARKEAMEDVIAHFPEYKEFVDPQDPHTFRPPEERWFGRGPDPTSHKKYVEFMGLVVEGIKRRTGGWVPPEFADFDDDADVSSDEEDDE